MSTDTPETRETPEQFLRNHELTLRLEKMGMQAAHLDGVSFRRRDGEAFSDWRVVSTTPWSPISQFVDNVDPKYQDDRFGRGITALVDAQRAWCTLRWLILDNPPESEDTRAAWELLERNLARPTYEAGEKQLKRLADGRRLGSYTQKERKDDEVLAQFGAWDTSPAARLVADKSPKARVRVYIRVKQIKARAARRLRGLLLEGKII